MDTQVVGKILETTIEEHDTSAPVQKVEYQEVDKEVASNFNIDGILQDYATMVKETKDLSRPERRRAQKALYKKHKKELKHMKKLNLI